MPSQKNKWRITLIFLLGLVLLSILARRISANDTGTITIDGRKRTYEVHVPKPYDASRAVPLVLVLHGRLGNGHGTAGLTHFDSVSDVHGFLVVYPDGLHRSWSDGREASPSEKEGVDDVKFLSLLIDKLSHEYNIDPARVYATGISNGGFMTQRLACDLSDKIAAVGIVAATMGEDTANACHPSRPVPVRMIHGTKDPLVPIGGGALGKNGSHGVVLSLEATALKWAKLDGCNPKPAEANLPDTADDGTSVRESVFSGCKAKAEVLVDVVENGGHTWPGGKQYLPAAIIGKTTRNLDASEALWEFFSKHSLPQ